MTTINSNTARFNGNTFMTDDDAVISKALRSARNLLNLIEGRTPAGYAIRVLLEGEGFDSAVMRAEVTEALDLPLPETAVAPPAASQRTGEVDAIVDTFQRTGVIDVLRVRAAIDAAVLAALDGINLREAVASLVEERVTNADLDIEEMAKEVIIDAFNQNVDIEEMAKEAVVERVDNADLDIEEMAKEAVSDKAEDLDMEDLAKEVISDLTGELDMEDLAKRGLEDSVDYADVVRDVIEAEFTRTDIKHEIREAITERITERLSNVQVSVTV